MRLIKSSAIYSMTYFPMVLMLCGLFMFPGVSHAAEQSTISRSVNMSGGSGNGSGSGTVTPDLFTGTMSYSIPIAVPEGRKGMSPGLSLDYRSNNGNGWVGVGWELEVGAIERSLKYGLSYTGDDYILRIAGGTVDLVQTATNEYRAKVESGFYRINKKSGSNGYYWEVTDKTGVRYLYGQTFDTRQDDPTDASKIFKWCLDRVEDTNGNFITIKYTKTPFNTLYANYGQIYLDRIDYTGHTSDPSTANWVKFYLESRTDAPDMYSTEFKVKTAYRLKTIDVLNGASGRIRTYELEYDTDPNTGGDQNSASTGRSLLTKVQQFGKDADVDENTGAVAGVNALPATTFTWQDSEAVSGTFPTSYDWTSAAAQGIGYSVILGDFDGDGYTDIYMFKSDTGDHIVWLNNGDGTFPATYTWQSGSGYGTGYSVLHGDFNGDGKTDIHMSNSSTGDHIVWLNNEDGIGDGKFPSSYSWHSSGIHGTGYSVLLGDFNGDGKADIHMFNPSTGDHIVWLNNGDGTFPANHAWQSNSGHGTGYVADLSDFNGDGKTDIYMFDSIAGDHIVWLNNGGGTFPTNYTWQSGSGYGSNYYTPQLGDFNGDGKIDIYMLMNNPLTRYRAHIVWLNKGDGSFPTSYTWQSAPFLVWLSNPLTVKLADFNGDGAIDIFMYYWYSPDLPGSLFLNKGDGTFPGTRKWYADLYGFAYIHDIQFGDFNGDGKTDIYRSLLGQHDILLNQGLYPDLLSSVSNGIGGMTNITYRPSTQYTNTLLPFPVQTVSSITTNDGNYNIATTMYTFSGGFYHIGDQDFRGFNYAKVRGPGSADQQIISETWFHQGNDTAVGVNIPAVSGGYMKGKPYRSIISNGQGYKFRETTIDYHANLSSFATNSFNPPHQVDNYVCEGASCGIHTKTVYEDYDNYGNVTIEQFYADANSTPYRKVVRSFNNDEANWLVGLPLTEDVYDGSGERMAGLLYFYDYVPSGETGCDTDSSSTTPTKGNLTRIEQWFNDPTTTGTGNPSVRMAYDDYGNLVCTRGPMATKNKLTLYYDGTYTFPLRARNALDQETVTEYYGVNNVPADDGLYGQVKSVTALHLAGDPIIPKTVMAYDAFGRKKSVTAPDTTETTWDYMYFGTMGVQHVKTDSSAGPASWAYFDGFGRTIRQKIEGPGGRAIETVTGYNPTGTVKRTKVPYFEGDSSEFWTNYTYDALGRTLQISNADNSTVQACYRSNISVVVDADKHLKRETKDALGRLSKVEEYLGTYDACTPDPAESPYTSTTYTYNVLGNIRSVKDVEQNETEMKYDSLGRKYYMKDPDMGVWWYTYDAKGNLWKQKDASQKEVVFSYDALNRVISKTYPTVPIVTTNVTYSYDEPTSTFPIGRLTKMTDASGTTTYNYDAMGRSTSVTKKVDGLSSAFTVTTGYEEGRLASITYPDGDIVRYTYGTGGELSVVRNDALTYAYAFYPAQDYTALMQPKTVNYGNGVSTAYDFYPENSRLRNITTSTSAEQLLNLSYIYTNGGNVESLTDNLNPNISSMAAPGQMLTYAYAGPKPHAVTSSDGIIYEYDDNNPNGNGNMTFDGVRRIKYDYDNMPQSIVTSLGTTTFVYDGAGARVKKTGPLGETVYIGKLYECTEGSCVKYIYAGGTRIAIKSGLDTFYYHQDHLGSSKVITSDTGENLEQIYYDPFGATSADVGAASVNHKYTSQELDAETGLYYYNARYYNPAMGRFTSPDTIVPDPSNSQAYNRYSYVLNNPMIYTDPSGHSFWKRARDWAKKPWHAFVIQNFGPTALLGTYYLTKSDTGRNILITEAAIAMIAVGACGPGPTNPQYAWLELYPGGAPPAATATSGVIAPDFWVAAGTVGTGYGVVSLVGAGGNSQGNDGGNSGSGGVSEGGGSTSGSSGGGLFSGYRSYLDGRATQNIQSGNNFAAFVDWLGIQSSYLLPGSFYEVPLMMMPIGNVGKIGVSGFTKHGINQAINRGILPGQIKDAVTNALRVSTRVDAAGRTATEFIGREATVILNSEGKVITVHGTHSSLVEKLLGEGL